MVKRSSVYLISFIMVWVSNGIVVAGEKSKSAVKPVVLTVEQLKLLLPNEINGWKINKNIKEHSVKLKSGVSMTNVSSSYTKKKHVIKITIADALYAPDLFYSFDLYSMEDAKKKMKKYKVVNGEGYRYIRFYNRRAKVCQLIAKIKNRYLVEIKSIKYKKVKELDKFFKALPIEKLP